MRRTWNAKVNFFFWLPSELTVNSEVIGDLPWPRSNFCHPWRHLRKWERLMLAEQTSSFVLQTDGTCANGSWNPTLLLGTPLEPLEKFTLVVLMGKPSSRSSVQGAGWKKIRLPLFWLSKRPRMSGHWIQKSLGHVVHFCMLKIPLLSVPRLFYSISFVTYAGHRRFAALDRGCCGSALAGGNVTLSLCRSARTIVLSVDSFGWVNIGHRNLFKGYSTWRYSIPSSKQKGLGNISVAMQRVVHRPMFLNRSSWVLLQTNPQ